MTARAMMARFLRRICTVSSEATRSGSTCVRRGRGGEVRVRRCACASAGAGANACSLKGRRGNAATV